MTPENNEYRRRQQQRAEQRRKREADRRRMIVRLVLFGAVLLACGLVIWLVTSGNDQQSATPSTDTDAMLAADTDATAAKPSEPRTVIHIAAAGDLNVNDTTVNAGKTSSGYDYSQVFLDVAPVLANADLTVLNFEGNLCGVPYGSENASAPQELLQAVSDAGVDLVQMANSYSIRNGLLGLSSTLDGIQAAGMEPLGAYASPEAFRNAGGYTIREIEGIKVAFVAFTKGMDNLGLPAGSENCVNLLYNDYATTYQDVATERITSILSAVAKEEPDYTIALLHWGSEYNDELSSTQEDIRDLMFQHGVDAILGTHPHLVQQVEFDREAGTFVAYSLGDLYSDAQQAGTNYSVILDLEITRDNETRQTKLTNYSYTPVYTTTPEESGESSLRIVRIEQAVEAYKAGYYDRVSQELYETMEYALERIESRINGEG